MRVQGPSQWGFTLVEMIMVIVITGILGTMVAVFIQAPVQGYVDSSRRAEMTDIADTALRRLARDIRTAVPNSIRVATCGGVPCIEFLPTRAGGRYRTGAPGDMLDFGVADGSFDIIGPAVTFNAGDYIVVGSTQSDGNPPYNTAAAGILRAYTGATGAPQATVNFTATALPVWAEVQGQRFDVVDGAQQAVTYACIGTLGALNANGDGQAQLVRYWNYGFNPAQVAPPLGPPAVLADRVSGCAITYNAISQRNGLVTLTLAITRGSETVSLYHEIHVNNVP
ncbi:MAG TPA: type II secretion system protein [Gallionellaceae bacterium]|nr:type II secretion system protein [Gallionellaceae bacterium]